MSELNTIVVRAGINTLGLSPGQVAEIEVTPQVLSSVELGFVTVLSPDQPVEAVPEPEPEPEPAPKKRAARRQEAVTTDDGADLSASD